MCAATSVLLLLGMKRHMHLYIYYVHPLSNESTFNWSIIYIHSRSCLYGCNVFVWCIVALSWHIPQLLTHSSISESKLHHLIWQRTRDFIREIPWWLSCKSLSKVARHFAGITTCNTHKTQTNFTDNFSFLFVYGRTSWDSLYDHPSMIHWSIWGNTGSLYYAKQQFSP